MSVRRTEESKVTLPSGQTVTLTLIENPTVDDVVVSEMKVQAQSVAEQVEITDRHVSRDIRDFLVRLGVER